ncbi:hypothetical protein [Larkinella punicea]|uniref:Exo-alpha-sialidase n=1 Tax=Larkinella punicea TaxID=2315727 RepID=A0A368JS99_9BACT|nr:hypothetical protein [Larkinella punicea]RCR70539.1 hypothetical protein DUE52_06210 [Larkinella punicea]
MKKAIIFLVTLVTILSCDQNTSSVTPAEDPDWIKIEVPNGREVYAIAGDLDKTLLVTTWTKAYYSVDKGKTWQESKDFNGPVPGLLVRNDTTFSMEARSFDQQGKLLGSSLIHYFTTDYGKNWKSYFKFYKEYMDTIKPVGMVKSAEGIIYTIKENKTPTAPGSSSYYINPGEIVKQNGLSQSLVRFPYKLNLMNLHLDTQGRLYVAASGGSYQPERNTFYCCPENLPGIIYVSKRRIP